MCEVKKCENLRLKPFLCMIWKEKVARHAYQLWRETGVQPDGAVTRGHLRMKILGVSSDLVISKSITELNMNNN